MSSAPNPNHFDSQNASSYDASYDARWAPLAPLRDCLHLQIGLILRHLPDNARILCVGVGTGAEIIALARQFPGWRFLASDPSEPICGKAQFVTDIPVEPTVEWGWARR